jgi:small subunit ribosomal protein S18
MARARTRRKGEGVERKPKKKVSVLDSEQISYIDYKDVNLLRRFMSERAKIRARRVTGNDAQQQREVAKAIRVAREMALLPYSVRQVTHRNKGKRGERGSDREGGGSREGGPDRDRRPAPELLDDGLMGDDATDDGALLEIGAETDGDADRESTEVSE